MNCEVRMVWVADSKAQQKSYSANTILTHMLRKIIEWKKSERQTNEYQFNNNAGVGEKQTDSVQFGEDDGNNTLNLSNDNFTVDAPSKCKHYRLRSCDDDALRILVYLHSALHRCIQHAIKC